MPRPAVVVAEGDPAARRELARALGRQGFTPLSVADGSAALRLAGGRRAAALVVAEDVPGLGGIGVCRGARAAGARLPIVVLWRLDDPRGRAAALDAGADDCLSAPVAVPELAARLRGLLRRGEGASAAAPLRVADLALDLAGRRATRAGDRLPLTPTELRLLEAFMRRPGEVLAGARLRRELWSGRAGAGAALPAHMSALRRKLEAGGRPRMIHTVRDGYVLDP